MTRTPRIRAAALLLAAGTLAITACVPEDGGYTGKRAAKSSSTTEPKPADDATTDNTPDVPVKVSAAIKESFKPGIFAEDGEDYIAVEVIVRNQGDKEISVNPMYFSAKDADGFKHQSAMGTGADGEMHHADLAPGENVKGIVVFEGDYTLVKIEFDDSGFGTTYSAPVN